MKRSVLALFVIGTLLLMVWPASSQGGEALVDYVTEVNVNLMDQDTAIFEGMSHVIIDMAMGDMAQHIEVTADIDGEYIFAEGDFEAWYTVLDQAFAMDIPGAGEMAFAMITESLMAEAVLYERTSSDNPMFASAFPTGWVIVDDAAGTPGAGGPMGDPTAMLPGIDITKLPYLIDDNTVTTVTELDPEVIDGREMRVFNVELDMGAVSNQFGAWSSGVDLGEMDEEEAALVGEMMGSLFAELVMDWTVWIDVEGELPYRSMGTMTGPLMISQQGMEMVMDLVLEFDMTFTEFNVPVTIEAPEIGS